MIRAREVDVAGARIHVLAAEQGTPVCLMLHGQAFTSRTWEELGTLELLAQGGARPIAVDLPGYGASERCELPDVEFLPALLAELGVDEPVVVISPSMSGRFSLPLVLEHPEHVAAYVPVGVAGLPLIADRVHEIDLPVLVFWGGEDRVFPLQQGRDLAAAVEGAELAVLEGAGHACYLDAPDEFHRRLIEFIAR